MKVIIECDDLGLDYGFTDAIKDTFKKGLTTSTCIRINGPAYKYSLKLLKNELKNIGLGIHVDLTHGPFLTKFPILFPQKYPLTFIEILIRTTLADRKLIKAIENEILMQFDKAAKDGLIIDHVTGHDHIHMIPKVFEIISKISKRKNLNRIRIADEPFRFTINLINLFKSLLLKLFAIKNRSIAKKYNLMYPDAMYGLIDTNKMNTNSILMALQDGILRNFETIEIVSHPAYANHLKDLKTDLSNFARNFTNLPNRKIELNALLNKKLLKFIKNLNIELITYKNI